MKIGFFAILGKPNAGKSTLLNRLVGEKVSIVSWRPQTTRNKINGIVNGEDYQIVFVDTPGIQHGKDKLSAYMSESVSSATKGADGILYVVDGSLRPDQEEHKRIAAYAKTTDCMIVVVNKLDLAPRERMFEVLASLNDIKDIIVVPVSAETGDNVDELNKVLLAHLQEGEAYYPTDIATDSTLRFMASEIVREKALKFLQEEIPHGIGVEIVKYTSREDGVEEIHADIVCEKDSHKAIIIGKGGETLKRIATAARKEMEDIAGCPVYLKLWVKVRPNWKGDSNLLSLLGYDPQDLKE